MPWALFADEMVPPLRAGVAATLALNAGYHAVCFARRCGLYSSEAAAIRGAAAAGHLLSDSDDDGGDDSPFGMQCLPCIPGKERPPPPSHPPTIAMRMVRASADPDKAV